MFSLELPRRVAKGAVNATTYRKGIFLRSRVDEQKRPEPIEIQPWEVALQPGTAGKTSNLVSGKYSFMFVCLWALTSRRSSGS